MVTGLSVVRRDSGRIQGDSTVGISATVRIFVDSTLRRIAYILSLEGRVNSLCHLLNQEVDTRNSSRILSYLPKQRRKFSFFLIRIIIQ